MRNLIIYLSTGKQLCVYEEELVSINYSGEDQFILGIDDLIEDLDRIPADTKNEVMLVLGFRHLNGQRSTAAFRRDAIIGYVARDLSEEEERNAKSSAHHQARQDPTGG